MSMRGSRILIAEDDQAIAAVLAEALSEVGVKALLAGDGAAGLAALQQDGSIPILLSDIRMPQMDGYELVRRAIRLQPELKVVMMTGYADEAPPPDVMGAREFRLLRKPVDFEALQALITDMLSRP
jgi:DNA-binding NtrC family response regulator